MKRINDHEEINTTNGVSNSLLLAYWKRDN